MLKVVFFCYFTYFSLTDGRDMKEMKRLIADKFKGYDKKLRPIKDQNSSVEVRVYFDLASIHEVAEVTEKFSVTGLLYIYWFDDHIKWNPEDYGGIEMITVPSDDVWYPRLALVNAFDKVNVIQNE